MSEKFFKVKPDADGDYFFLVAGEKEIPIRDYHKFAFLQIDCDHLNTAADAWKARETKSDSLKSMFAKYRRLYDKSDSVLTTSIYGDILHELRYIAAELGIELEKK